MIRNVVMGRLRPGVPRRQVEQALAALVALEPEGCLAMVVGVDAGLRDGNWDYAITADFVDEQAYRRYDLDVEHGRLRTELFAPMSEQIVRIQVEV